jgi:hypothetical protein
VRPDDVEEGAQDLRWIKVQDSDDLGFERRRIKEIFRKELDDGRIQRIIHHTVELRAIQPRKSIVPDLSEKKYTVLVGSALFSVIGLIFTDILLLVFELLAEKSPEFVVDLVGHVESPAVDVELLDPVAAHSDQIVNNVTVAGVHLGHVSLESEGFIGKAQSVFSWSFVTVKPIPLVGPAPVLYQILKEGVLHPEVVHYRVEHHLDPQLVSLLHQFSEVSLSAKVGIDGKVINSVILVICGSGEDRRQIKSVDAKVFQIRHLLENPRKVPPEKAVDLGLATAPRQRIWIQRGIAVIEALREDLIPDGLFGPSRRIERVVVRDIRQGETIVYARDPSAGGGKQKSALLGGGERRGSRSQAKVISKATKFWETRGSPVAKSSVRARGIQLSFMSDPFSLRCLLVRVSPHHRDFLDFFTAGGEEDD